MNSNLKSGLIVSILTIVISAVAHQCVGSSTSSSSDDSDSTNTLLDLVTDKLPEYTYEFVLDDDVEIVEKDGCHQFHAKNYDHYYMCGDGMWRSAYILNHGENIQYTEGFLEDDALEYVRFEVAADILQKTLDTGLNTASDEEKSEIVYCFVTGSPCPQNLQNAYDRFVQDAVERAAKADIYIMSKQGNGYYFTAKEGNILINYQSSYGDINYYHFYTDDEGYLLRDQTSY